LTKKWIMGLREERWRAAPEPTIHKKKGATAEEGGTRKTLST
jgi:hypothetical protein